MARRQRRSQSSPSLDEEVPAAASPRRGARRTVMYYIRQLPQYLRLLGGLLTDRRVALVDKLLVIGAIA